MPIIQFFSTSVPRRLVGFVLAVALFGGCFFLLHAALDPLDCRMAEGVTIGGLDVSGMTRWEARKALKTALEESLYRESMPIALPRETLTLSPEDAGIRVNIGNAVRDAYQIGRDDGQTENDIGLLPYLRANEEAIRAILTDYAARYDTDLTPFSYRLDGDTPQLSTACFDASVPCQTLVLTLGIPDVKLDVTEVYSCILEEYNRAITECAAGQYGITVEVPPLALPEIPDLQAIYQEFSTEAVNDSLDMQTYEFVSGTYGYGFDLKEAQKLLAAADCGETITIPMEYTAPEIIGEAVYFRDVLGAYETRHTDNENRNTNLRLLCQAIDGLILQPGEEFSFNGTVGERTREKGYKPAPAYSGNRLVDSYGGGVCQGSTTLYNCVLLADLEVVFRACHGASVGYVPAGLDAAVNWGTTDFQFKNNFHFPIRLQAEVSDGYVKMQILGTDEKDYYIKMESRSGEDEKAVYARSYKCKYDKETNELISRELEAYSTYYKDLS